METVATHNGHAGTGGGSETTAYTYLTPNQPDPVNQLVSEPSVEVGIDDFDLLKVLGKGGFGKVMLVRKRKGLHAGEIFALKVMQKSVVVAHGQQRHALAERTILERVSHPFIVQLRFAFQNDQKLYLVTSFYPGGNLFFHLRRSGALRTLLILLVCKQLLNVLC